MAEKPHFTLSLAVLANDINLVNQLIQMHPIRVHAADNNNSIYMSAQENNINPVIITALASIPAVVARLRGQNITQLGEQALFAEGAMRRLSLEQLAAIVFLKHKYANEFNEKTIEEHLNTIRQYLEAQVQNKGLPLFDFQQKTDPIQEKNREQDNAEGLRKFPPLDLNEKSRVPQEKRLKKIKK